MKIKVDWKALGKALWDAVKPVLLAAVGGGIVSLSSGCSSLTPANKCQTMGVYAFGLPAIAVIRQSEQASDNRGEDTNAQSQSNPITTTVPIIGK